MEVKVAAQDVVAQQAPLLQKLDGVAQTGNGHGILGTDVDIAIFRADSVARDHHAFNELEGVAFHNGAVHERAGVALVAVADHIPHGFLLTGNLLPLLAGGEAAAATAPETGGVHFVDYIVPGHFEHGLLQSGKAAGSQVFVQRLGVKLAAVLQNDPGLLGDEGDFVGLNISFVALLVEQPLDDLVANNALFQNFLAVVGLNLDVLDDLAALLDADQGAQLTEALAAGLLDAYSLVVVVAAAWGEHQLHTGSLLNQFRENFVNLIGAGGDTAGAGADQNPAIIELDLLAGGSLGLHQFFSSLNH